MSRSVVMSLLLSATLAACGGGSGDDDDTPDGGNTNTGMYYHYVSSSLKTPAMPADKNAYGLNIDGDPQNTPDNALGGLLQFLGSQGFTVQETIDSSIAMGSAVMLHSLRADDLATDASASWQVYLGDATAAPPAFNGMDMFTISAMNQPAILQGAIAASAYKGGPGTVVIQLPLVQGQAPLTLHLVGARIDTSISGGSLSATAGTGNLGGAITKNELDTIVIPAVAQMVSGLLVEDMCVAAMGMCTCPMGSTGATIESFGLDPNHDCVVTTAEIMGNAAIGAFLAPDLDLLDCMGAVPQTCDPAANFKPRTDNVNDSLSLGVRFAMVNGVFTSATEM